MSPHDYAMYNNTREELAGGAVVSNYPLKALYPLSGNKVGCPIIIHDRQQPAPRSVPTGCNSCASNSCGAQQNYYIEPHVDYYEVDHRSGPIYVENDPETGYITDSFAIPSGEDFALYSGKGIWLESLAQGIRINNSGVTSVNVFGANNSGIIVTNNNTLKDPQFQITIQYSTLVEQGNLVTAIKYNGVTYSPTNGLVDITTAGGSFIQNIVSPNKTVLVTSVNATTVGVDVKPPRVNGISVTPSPTDGTPFNLVNGRNTVAIVTDNEVAVSVADNTFIKRIVYEGVPVAPDSNGQVTLGSGTSATGKYQVAKSLDASLVSALTGSGLDLTGVTPTSGPNAPTILDSDLVMVYLNDNYIDRTKYTRSGPSLKLTGVVPVAGQVLSWIVIK